MKNIKRQLVNYRNAMVMHMWNVKNKLQDTSGEGYVDTAIKILIAVVLGALLLAGLYALFNDTVLPTLVRRVQDMEIRISLLQAVQAVLFFSLLIAVSAWDLRYRIIPDRFQAGIALLSFLNFAPGQLLGALGAVPYLIVALFCKREGGMGGGDIKLAGATGLVLGLPASLTASCLGLTGFVMYGCMVCLWNRFKGKRDKEAFPVGPFLAGGAAAVYCMRLGGWMI